ncbi:ADP-ribose glycohydrolase OARD1-like [Teleopsis dalmanni]|uniref:ADP-ribose glycohydrolase OARD1-like n=1 Tax=Teleopsis dalmanni TaxID=139649 RepID=UPI0018CD5BF7|nr:ADP-ribose glycohydrolase OARD1-like [Teleopsis dalmanni]
MFMLRRFAKFKNFKINFGVVNLQPKALNQTLFRTVPENNKKSFSTGTANFATQQMATKEFALNEVEGDLFSAPKNFSLAHCVAADFGMGAGIAVKFKQMYGSVDELLSQGVQTGGVAVLKDNDRFVYYLVTKRVSSGKPTYNSLRSSLQAMCEHMRCNNVDKLAMPRIGCGIDGLQWDKVSTELKGVFGKDKLEIVVYNFVPK